MSEVPGSEAIRQTLEQCIPLVAGQPIGRFIAVLNGTRSILPGGKTAKQTVPGWTYDPKKPALGH